MAADPHSRHLTVEEYLELDRNDPEHRYEYYDGDVWMMTGGTLNHSEIKGNIIAELKRTLRGSECRPFDSDARVKLSQQHYVYPDATISCAPEDRGTVDLIRTPKVVFEVLSPSTERSDRGRKFILYSACPSIEEYVLINTAFPLVEVHSRNGQFFYLQSYQPGETFTLNSVGISIAVDDIYYAIQFPPTPSANASQP